MLFDQTMRINTRSRSSHENAAQAKLATKQSSQGVKMRVRLREQQVISNRQDSAFWCRSGIRAIAVRTEEHVLWLGLNKRGKDQAHVLMGWFYDCRIDAT